MLVSHTDKAALECIVSYLANVSEGITSECQDKLANPTSLA